MSTKKKAKAKWHAGGSIMPGISILPILMIHRESTPNDNICWSLTLGWLCGILVVTRTR